MMFAPTDSIISPAIVSSSMRGPASDRFMLKSEGSFIFLPYDEVQWIEAQGDYVKFHAAARSCMVRMTMKTLDASLDEARFLRVHRSAAVNIDRIEKISPFGRRCREVVLRCGVRVPIGGAYYARVREFCRAAFGLVEAGSGASTNS